MIKGNINGQRFEIPENYKELTLGQLEKLSEVTNPLEQFSVLSGIDLDTLLKVKHGEVEYLLDQITELFSDADELNELSDVVDSVTLRGVELVMDKDLLTIPAGQWFDLKKYESDLKDKPFEFIRRALSILMRPEGEEYDHAKCSERLDWFNDLDVITAFKVRGFFLTNLDKYLRDSNLYSQKTTHLKRLGRVIVKLVTSLGVYLRFIIWQKINQLFRLCLAKKKK